MGNMTSRWFLVALVALSGSGCLAERASTADLKAAAAAANPADATLDVGSAADSAATDGLAGDSLEDAAADDDSGQLQGDETAGDVAILADADALPADAALDGVADAAPDAPDGSAAPDGQDAAGTGADGDTAPPCPAGTPCNDGDPCTVTDTCTAGICAGKPKACGKLADACHSASCGAGGECVVVPLATCEDGNPCTDDGCDDKMGCTHADNSALCSDGNLCTVDDVCKAGKCASGLNKCGCTQTSDCAGKEDGDFCNGTLLCDKSTLPYQCSVNPATVKTCDASQDGPCVKTACVPASGLCVKAIANTGKACDADGSVCTVADACKGGVCLPGSVTSCDDGNGGGGAGCLGDEGGYMCAVGGSASTGAGGQGGKGGNSNGGAGGQGGTATTSAAAGLSGGIVQGQLHGGGGGGGGFRGATAANLHLQVAGNLSGTGTLLLVGHSGGKGEPGGFGMGGGGMGWAPGNGGGGGGGGGGAGGALVLRAAGTITFSLSSQLSVTGGKGGTGANPGQPGPAGYVDYAYLAGPGTFGSWCGPANPCGNTLSCQPISAAGLCTSPVCIADVDCQFGQAPLGKCIGLAAAALNGAKTCFPPCSATMACARPDFTCDLTKGACVPDCRVQTGGFCPYFKTCDAKTGLCADVPCSGTCTAGSICWSNACAKQVCTPDCTAAVAKACSLDVDCASGVCLAGQCAACPTGSKCQVLSKVCASDGAAPACVP